MASDAHAPAPARSHIELPLLGTSFAMLLYGVLSMQTYLYFQRYRNDSTIIRAVVGSIWIMETLYAALSCHFVQHYFVTHFADPFALEKIEWSLALVAVLGMIIGLTANMFFIWRIWLLSKRRWIPICAAMLAVTRAVLGIYVSCLGFPYNTWASFLPHAYGCLLAGLAIEVVVNSIITVAVSYELLHGRSGMQQTDAVVTRLLIYTVNTGAMTSFVAIAEIITFVALPHTVVFLAFVFVQSKLYANCLLATLNARKAMRARTSLGFGSALHKESAVTSVKFRGAARTRTIIDNEEIPAHNGIGVYTETVVKSDADSTGFSDASGHPFIREKAASLTMTV